MLEIIFTNYVLDIIFKNYVLDIPKTLDRCRQNKITYKIYYLKLSQQILIKLSRACSHVRLLSGEQTDVSINMCCRHQFPGNENSDGSRNVSSLAVQPLDAAASQRKFR
jgi:hypothetical protein